MRPPDLALAADDLEPVIPDPLPRLWTVIIGRDQVHEQSIGLIRSLDWEPAPQGSLLRGSAMCPDIRESTAPLPQHGRHA